MIGTGQPFDRLIIDTTYTATEDSTTRYHYEKIDYENCVWDRSGWSFYCEDDCEERMVKEGCFAWIDDYEIHLLRFRLALYLGVCL